jgi:hypothetical protein
MTDSPVSQPLVLETPLQPPPAGGPAQHRPPPLAKGLLLAGRFELIRPLGAGGLAEVWLARDRTLGAEVAVKALHAHLARDQPLCERFRRELAVTRGLDHPGIVKVYDLFDHGGRPFFSMELLRGQTLADRLRAGKLAPDEARAIAQEVAAALQAAHRAGVVHRDLKPQNVFLEAAPVASAGGARSVKLGSLRVKLLDFGLARAAGQARMTAASTVLGTPGYIAPEVLDGAPADGRADLYALGAVLFELFTGKRAFASVDAWAVLEQKRRAPPALRPLCPEATAADEALVARCLEPDPERRFLDAGQLLRALGGGPVPEAPPSLPALTSGPHDVVVRRGIGFGERTRLKRALARLGLEWPGLSWGMKLTVTGQATLASGASRATADALVAALQAEGVGAQVVPQRPRSKLARWLGSRGWLVPAAGLAPAAATLAWGALETSINGVQGGTLLLGIALATLGGPLFGAAAMALTSLAQGVARAAPLASEPSAPVPVGPVRRWLRAARKRRALSVGAAWALIPSCVIAALVILEGWGGHGKGAASWVADQAHLLPLIKEALREAFLPPFILWGFAGATAVAALLGGPEADTRLLEEGDPAVRRLAAGIERRLGLLQARLAAAPESRRMVLAGLAAAARDLGQQARGLAARAASLTEMAPAQLEAAGAEVPTLPHGLATSRDHALDRLLEIAAALDDALAAADAAEGPADSAAQVELGRLRAQVRAEEPGAGQRVVPEPEPLQAVEDRATPGAKGPVRTR